MLITDDDKQFAPGKIDEICHSDSGGEKRIIFIETSGESCLRPRQACAVESAARSNPDMDIYVYMAINRPPGEPEEEKGNHGLERHCKTMELLKSFENLHILREDLPLHFLSTPLESLYFNGLFNDSEYSYQHLSDALRIILLYKYGGIYIDLDVIVFRSLRCLRNTAGHVLVLGESSVENGVMIFDRGHKLLNFFLKFMSNSYKPYERSSIGPKGLSDAFRIMCNHSSNIINDSVNDYLCDNQVSIKLLNNTAFYPITFFEQNRFFIENFQHKELRFFRNSYSVHVYGAGHGARVPETSLFAYLAKQFCPSIFNQHVLGTYVF